jgi:hypothetical protein
MGKFLSASVPAYHQMLTIGKLFVLPFAVHREVCKGLVLLFGTLAITLAPSARADSIYEYTGNEMNQNGGGTGTCPTPCVLSVMVDFSVPLPQDYSNPAGDTQFSPNFYTITDGTRILNNTDSTFQLYLGSTNSSGAPTTWSLRVFDAADGIIFGSDNEAKLTIFPGVPTVDVTDGSFSYSALNINDPGTWVVESNVPEPSLLPLGIGLLGLGTVSRMVGNRRLKRPVA